MLGGNAFQNLGAITEKALSFMREKRERESEGQVHKKRTRINEVVFPATR